MLALPNYELTEKLAETPQAAVYRGFHKRNPDRPLVLKVLKGTPLSDYKKSQFRQRIEHLRVLQDNIAITPIAFEALDGSCVITQDFFDGVTLDRLTEARNKLTLDEFLGIACGLARALDKVHEAGITHGGIKPHNVLVSPATLETRMIDFISAIDVRDVSHFIYDPSFIRNTLCYTSPEQTGRINHRVSFSSDMYSLGVVFYELLAGELPFASDDPLEVIHSHLAEQPPEVHELNAEVPVAVSRIIAKLMLKEPEKRYQSSNALLGDLLRCRAEYADTGTVRDFPLESCVNARRVTFISKMVGRDTEAEAIFREYEQVAAGEFRSMIISGLSGIGKTRLIQELQKPIVRHRGYFTSGKFDVYQRNIPYSSLIQALRNLVRTLLTESDERVAAWRDRVLDAVGASGRVLTDVIPELEILIGPQPEVPELPPVESLNRFHDVFDRFLTCLAREEHPLTLFIDDLQWCDAASFDFLANVFSNYRDHPYLFFLGAYRHNEVDSSHPLAKLLRSAREGNRPLKEIRLGPLRPEHCHEMVSYILDYPPAQTGALSDFISDLSEGNPLFVSESLSYLHNENLLYLDDGRQWRWDMDKIRRSAMPTTVVALFSSKIQKLPPEVVALLEYCACMGNTFPPEDLALIREMSLLETFEMLKPALGQGLLMENKNQLQFIHDKVQEAALSAIPPGRRRDIHRLIGNHLLSAAQEGPADLAESDGLFGIVSHLNLAREEDLDSSTAYLLSDLNYQAGSRALRSLATEAADAFFSLSRELLPDDCWEEAHYEHTFKVYQKAAKTALMCGRYADSERLLNQLLDHATTDLDKAECLAEQTTSLSSIGSFARAIDTANRGLAYFGKAIPDDPGECDERRAALMAGIASHNADVWETILQMPFTEDRRSKIELAFYSELIPDLYMSGLVPQLYLSAAQSTQHCLAGGMDESVIYSFSIMGLQLGEQGEFEQAFRYEDLARDLSAKYPNTFGATRGMNGIVWCNMHSRSHPRQIVDYCLKAIQCGRNCGDLYNAGLSYGPLMWNLQVQGADLRAIEDYARECLQFSNRYHLSFSVGLAEAMLAGWIAPMKNGYTPVAMDDKLAEWEQANHVASAGSYYVHLALAHYYLGEHEKAQGYLEEVRRYLSGLTDNVLKRQWHVFLVLNELKLYERQLGAASAGELLERIRPIIAKVEAWAALGPLLKPYLAFLRAELERATGTFREARSLYLDAIDSAHAQGYTFLEGHLNQCLGELLREVGQCSEKVYFTEAARLYRKCAAERKELGLIERYPEYFEADTGPYQHADVISAASSILPNLDVDYLMKSSLAISAEMEQDVLLKKIMNVVIESSGAQSGYLLMEEAGNLVVRAESQVAERETRALGRRLEEAEGVCKAIARYVHRTGERVILGDARQEDAFKDHAEVQEMELRSVLCLPVVKQSKRIGLLYLDNRLADHVFTPERTQVTELLTSQAAIALENARLVEALTQSEAKFRGIFEQSPAGIVLCDTNGDLVDLNPACLDLFGLAPDTELRGLNLFADPNISPESREGLRSGETVRFQASSDLSQAQELGLFATSRIGQRHLDVLVTPLGETLSGYLVQALDVTERVQAERARDEERERLAVTLRSIGDGVIATDAYGRVALMNSVAEALCGWSEPEAVGRQLAEVFEIYNERSGERAQDPVARVLETGQVQGLANHTILVSRDGTRRYLADSAAPIRYGSSGVVGVVLVFQDVTLQRKLEEEVLKANKLQSLGVLAGGIAHDFNNLLVGVLGNIVLAKLDAPAAGEQQELLTEAEKASNRAKGLTQQLLTFAKGGEPLRRAMSLGPTLVEASTFALRGSAGCRGEYDIAPDLWPAEVDGGQIAQVLHNLIINAIQAMPSGGLITVSAANHTVTEVDPLPLPPGEYVRVSVADTGPGIPAENHSRIFDPYFTTKPGGSGLGLAVCYSVVNKHDGCITVESELGRGAAFHMYLPAAVGAAAQSDPPRGIAGTKGRVLVMDDEEMVQRVAKRMLEKLGYEAEAVGDGAAAVERYHQALVRGRPYDAVILDLAVPGGLGGLETLKRLRLEDPEVRAIVCSGYSNDPAMSHFASFGFAAMLDKPANLEDMQAALETAMESQAVSG